MKALLINPTAKSIEEISVASLEEIASIIGYDTIISDDVDPNGDKLYFDEECFLRGTEGRFQLDKLIPVSGKGVIVGSNKEGELADYASSLENLISRIVYL